MWIGAVGVASPVGNASTMNLLIWKILSASLSVLEKCSVQLMLRKNIFICHAACWSSCVLGFRKLNMFLNVDDCTEIGKKKISTSLKSNARC